MSGQSGISAVDQILRDVDLAGIQDERARECIRLLLNLIESLTADLRKSVAVAMPVTRHPPHGSVLALLTHTVLTSGVTTKVRVV